jgi:hypothetical protein
MPNRPLVAKKLERGNIAESGVRISKRIYEMCVCVCVNLCTSGCVPVSVLVGVCGSVCVCQSLRGSQCVCVCAGRYGGSLKRFIHVVDKIRVDAKESRPGMLLPLGDQCLIAKKGAPIDCGEKKLTIGSACGCFGMSEGAPRCCWGCACAACPARSHTPGTQSCGSL